MDIMSKRRPSRRLFYWVLAVFAATAALAATGPQLTIVSDVVYRANGQPAAGTIVVSWPAFNTADQKPVAAGELSIAIGAQGTVNFSLAPNEGADPGGTYYKAIYKLTDGTSYTEYWVVPAASPTTIAAIRATVVPRQVGAQYVNRQYVDTAVSLSVHKAGNETIDGAKSFLVSPEVPAPATGTAAVNKDYVAAEISAISEGFVDRAGDSMVGPLTLPNDPTAPGHATNRLYVDQQIADVTSAMGFKLGRLNDTPITLATVRYASQFDSIQAAVDDLPAPGGTVVIPKGEYALTSAIDVGTKAVVLQGQGWTSATLQAPFGHALWNTAVTGTVLRVAGANNAVNLANAASYNGGLVIRDVAIVGPGSGTSRGFSKSGATFYALGVTLDNVLLANFASCLYLDSILDSQFNNVWLSGCDKGIEVPVGAVANELTFTNLRIQGTTTAAEIKGGQKWLVNGGLTQGNTNGWLFAPGAVPLSHSSTMIGHWFEANTNYDFKVDSTAAAANGWTFLGNRHSNTGAKYAFTGANSTNNFVWLGTDAAGVDLTIPSTAQNWIIQSGRFATITDNGLNTLILGNAAGKGIIRLPATQAIQGPTGVGLIGSAANGDVQMGRYGAATAGKFAARFTEFGINNETGSTGRFYVFPSSVDVQNGLNLRVASDASSTIKFQVEGSSGNVSSVGRANFNGGVCQDSAQTVCDLSGSGAPTGACTTGSTYRRTDGGSATTLYVCENSAWAAGGGGGSTWSSIANPSGAQSLAMAANASTWTWNAATGAGTDLFRLTDTAGNTGTGHLLSVETAASSNLKPLQIKARGSTVLEMNEFGVLTSVPTVTTSSGFAMQVGGAVTIKGRDDWSAPVAINGADFSGATSTASNTTIRGGDTTSTTGANTGGNLLLRAGGSSSSSGTPGTLQVAQTFLRDTTVTSGLLQCFKAAAAMTVGDCGNSAINSVGVAISSNNINPVVVQFQGVATLQFDASASPSAGWFACSSATQGGKVTVQSGACAAGRQIGIVAQNGSSITSGKVFLQAR